MTFPPGKHADLSPFTVSLGNRRFVVRFFCYSIYVIPYKVRQKQSPRGLQTLANYDSMERVVGAAVCDLADAAGSRGVLLSLRRVQQHRANETRTSHPFRRAMGDGQWREGRGEKGRKVTKTNHAAKCRLLSTTCKGGSRGSPWRSSNRRMLPARLICVLTHRRR